MLTSAEALAAGKAYHRSGRIRDAEQCYRQVVQAEPENAEVFYLLGAACHSLGKLPDAIASLARAVQLQPDLADAQHHLGVALAQSGDLDQAVACYRRSLALKFDNPVAHNNLGTALETQGKLAESETEYREAIKLKPDIAEVHTNLGNVLGKQERLDEAAESHRRAIVLKPLYADAHNNLGAIFEKQGRLDEAASCYRRAFELKPDFTNAHNNLGAILQKQGNLEEAAACYRRVLEIDPHRADVHNNLGAVLQEQGKLEAAAACCRRAVELAPEYAQAHGNLSLVLRDQEMLDAAMISCRRALELMPDYTDAHLNLGELHKELGELAAAEEAFRAAIKSQPAHALPHARLANLLAGNLPDPDRIALEARLADPRLHPDARAQLSFALAGELDARGQYGRAAELLRQANALRWELNRDYRAYLPAEHEQMVDDLIRVFDRDFFERFATAGIDARRPAFIIGLPRSGTTLVEQVLASHSQVHAAGELEISRRSFEAIPAAMGRSARPIDCIARLDSTVLAGIARQHLEWLRQIDGGRAARIVDKMPDNYLYLGFLKALFPRATFIHCRRDLRDVAISCWMTDFRHFRWTNHPQHIASRFQQYRRLMGHWHDVLDAPVHDVDYEELVADTEGVARRLLAACGLAWEPACLQFHRTRRAVLRTPTSA